MSHLLLSTHTKYMVFGGSPVIDDLWGKVKILSEAEFNATRLPPSSELYPYLNGKDDLSLSITRFPNVSPTTSNSLVAILHSSGSTGLPRPVEIYQESVLISLVQQCTLFLQVFAQVYPNTLRFSRCLGVCKHRRTRWINGSSDFSYGGM